MLMFNAIISLSYYGHYPIRRFEMNVVERLLKYVRFETTSDENSETIPSTSSQKVLGQALVDEMKELGIEDAFMDEYGYVYGTIPGTKADAPVVGLIAHMDTSPDASGKDVNPRIEYNYQGGDILLNEAEKIYLSPDDYPILKKYEGNDIIVTDGKTLLGADDKAGIAAIMSAAEKFIKSDRPHGTIKLAFTPDEEIGRGPLKFDVKGFGADYAYTIDGGTIGGIEYENFNAAAATVKINGKNIHPGSAKEKMKNSILIAMEFQSLLPTFERPEFTEKYEGFSHLNEISGNVEMTKLHYILRDHDSEKLEKKKQNFLDIADYLNRKYGADTIVLDIKDSYRNMKEILLDHMYIVEKAKDAMIKLGVTPHVDPIRGGTDGAQLSFMGLPCPNIFTGGENMHGRFEFIPVQSLEKCQEVIENIIYDA